MTTEILTLDPSYPSEADLKEAGEIIKRGGLVAFPTETVYGLGGNALDPSASRKIYSAKGRPSDNPLIVHIADMEALGLIAAEVPRAALEAAKIFWPGPLTMIFRKTDAVPKETTGGLDTVAVRMPSSPIAAGLIRAGGGYIAAPSANLSGRPSPTRAAHVIEDMDGRIDMIIDGGDSDIGLESTIVDMTGPVPTILRPGFISRHMLSDVIGEVVVDPALREGAAEDVRPRAPGMKYRHYAPRAPLYIVEGRADAVRRRIRELLGEAKDKGLNAVVLASEESAEAYAEMTASEGDGGGDPGQVISLGRASDGDDIGHNLYDALRKCDELEAGVIYSEAFDVPKARDAIMNRLLKAAGHNVIKADDVR